MWKAECVFRTLRMRIVALTALVVITSVVLTAVMVSLAVQRATRQETAQSLRRDTDIYQELLDHASHHATWDDVAPLVKDLSIRYDRRIALGTDEGIFVDSDVLRGLDSGELRLTPDVIIDPLNPWTRTADDPKVETIDRNDDEALAKRLEAIEACLSPQGLPFLIDASADEADLTFLVPVPDQLWPDVLHCLLPVKQPLPRASTDMGLTMEWLESCVQPALVEAGWVNQENRDLVISDVADRRIPNALSSCIDQHRDSVSAPPVQLHLGSQGGNPLSLRGLATPVTALIVTCIIAVAGVAGVMLATRIVRPLRTLTAAANQLGEGELDVRVDVSDRSEIGQLAETFNSMAESLDRSEKARRQLIADIAHELGNPMVTIGGGLEAIQDGVYEPSPEVIASLTEEATHLQRLITDLRELALADSGSLPIGRAEVDLGEVVAATVAAHTPIAKAAGVELTVEGAAPRPVLGDETRLRQVLANLLSNAIHHTPAGGVVTVRMSALPATLRLEVVDTGEGIHPDHLPHIFERFWRADSSRHRDGGRTGLGLAISDTLIRAQGGTIDVASTLGVGTAFTIELPTSTGS